MTTAAERAASWISGAERVAALTGAGISTESGIPDFRGPNGIWTKDPAAEKLSDISWYMGDSRIRVKAWRARLAHPVWAATPNPAHEAFAELERIGKLQSLATQNVDGLHQRSGSSPGIVIELHGTIHEVMCMSCNERAPMQRALDRVRAGEADPACLTCGGILKSATVSFGQSLDPDLIDRAYKMAAECDVYLAVGTSLAIYPAAGLPEAALSNGARLVIINEEPTPYDRYADTVLGGRASVVLNSLVNAL